MKEKALGGAIVALPEWGAQNFNLICITYFINFFH